VTEHRSWQPPPPQHASGRLRALLSTGGRWLPAAGQGRRLAALLLAGLVLVGAGLLRPAPRGLATPRTAYAVSAGGSLLGYTADPEVVVEATEALTWEVSVAEGRLVVLAGEVTVAAVPRPEGAALITADRLKARLAAHLRPATLAVAVLVDGQPVVLLGSEAEARAAVSGLLEAYVASLETSGGVRLLEVRFAEAVDYRTVEAEPDAIRDPEAARRILGRGTDQVLVHVVRRNESLWSIARQHGLGVDDLRRANPQLRGDLLQIGQRLNLIVPRPYLNVVSVEERTVLQSIPFPVVVEEDPARWPWEQVVRERGSYGQQELVYRISRLNGAETDRSLLSQRVLREPVRQVVVRGTRLVPPMGTGRFVWPLAEPGQITSGFGWRGRRLHEGIDIAAPVGTPVRAADAGVVIRSEWYGEYGRVVFIDHGEGRLVTVYAHNSANLVQVGDVVQQGQIIARVGSTGRSTGPHLHFEVWVDGRPVDPLRYFPSQ